MRHCCKSRQTRTDLKRLCSNIVCKLPSQVELAAGPVHAAACSYAVDGAGAGGTATVAAGAPLRLAVTARDAFGNLAALPAGALQAAATGPQGSVPFEAEVRSLIMFPIVVKAYCCTPAAGVLQAAATDPQDYVPCEVEVGPESIDKCVAIVGLSCCRELYQHCQHAHRHTLRVMLHTRRLRHLKACPMPGRHSAECSSGSACPAAGELYQRRRQRDAAAAGCDSHAGGHLHAGSSSHSPEHARGHPHPGSRLARVRHGMSAISDVCLGFYMVFTVSDRCMELVCSLSV